MLCADAPARQALYQHVVWNVEQDRPKVGSSEPFELGVQRRQPHILTLSPPISLEPRWLGPHIAYTIAKYGMSLCALGFAEEFREAGIGSNALWPRTLIATAAVHNLLGGRRGDGRLAQAGSLRGRRVRRHHTAESGVHRQHVPLRGRPRRTG